MKKALLFGLALSCLLGTAPASFADPVNMDAAYGDRQPDGYQQLTTHYHNYWRSHHSPWSNIERERHVVQEAQDFDKLTSTFEGGKREHFVRASDNTVRARFQEYVWNGQKSDFNADLPASFVEQVKSRPSMEVSSREALKMNEFLPKPLSYNDITYMPDDFTRKELHMPDQRFRSGLLGNDLVLYDTVTGRLRGVWKDIIPN